VKHTFEAPIFFKMSKVQCKHMMSNLRTHLHCWRLITILKKDEITIPTSKCDIYDWNNICLMINPNQNEFSNFSFGQNISKTLNFEVDIFICYKMEYVSNRIHLTLYQRKTSCVGLRFPIWRPRFKPHNWHIHGQCLDGDHM